MKPFVGFLLIVVLLFACIGNEEKLNKELSKYLPSIEKNDLLVIPDSVSKKMYLFGTTYPQNTNSEKYLRCAFILSDHYGRILESAKHAEKFNELFPKSKFAEESLNIAALNYGKVNKPDKELEMYSKIIKQFPNSNSAKEAQIMIDLIKKGKLSAEEQLNEILKRKGDSI